jgi:parallel beta-helix repeat protein
VACEKGTSPTFESCVFTGNEAMTEVLDDGGGAVHAAVLSAPTFLDCQFVGNHTEDLVGMEGGGAIRSTFGSGVTASECEFEGNSVASEIGAFGGAIYDSGGVVTLTDCAFTSNTATAGGAFTSYISTVTQTGCTYTDNSSNFAGAVYDAMSFATYEGCTFDGNVANDTGSDNSGGAYVANTTATVTMTGCVFTNNSTPDAGGGVGTHNAFIELVGCEFIGNVAARGGGVFSNVASVVTLEDCRIEGNTATLGGGGIHVNSGTEGSVSGCTLIGNTAPEGGAGRIRNDTQVSFTNTLFAGNQATGLGGALIVAEGGGTDAFITVVNSTFSDNKSVVGGAITIDDGGHATVANSILWGDDAGSEIAKAFAAEAIVSYSDVEGGWEDGESVLDVDPMFVDPDGGDYRILADAITDAGDNCAVPLGVDADLDGHGRFVDYPGAANSGLPGCEGGDRIVDLGAYERQCAADCDGDGALNILDFVCFQGLFQAGDPAADCDGDGELNILDFVCFQGAFQAGCP